VINFRLLLSVLFSAVSTYLIGKFFPESFMGFSTFILYLFSFVILFILFMSMFIIRAKSKNSFLRFVFNPILVISLIIGSFWGFVSLGVMFIAGMESGLNIFLIVLFYPGYLGLVSLGLSGYLLIPVVVFTASLPIYLILRYLKLKA